jgi:hypothetical protein
MKSKSPETEAASDWTGRDSTRKGGVPWGIIAVLLLVYCVGASGRNGNADAEIMLAQTRALMAGQIAFLPGDANGRGTEGVGGMLYSNFGVGGSVAWIPFVAAGRFVGGIVGRQPIERWEEFAVSFCPPVLAAALLALLARMWLSQGASASRVRSGLWLFGFASLIWPYSKLIGSDLMMAILLLLGIHVADRIRSSRGFVLAGLIWGAAYLTRKQLVSISPALLAWICWLGWSRSQAVDPSRRWRDAAFAGATASVGLVAAGLFKLWWNHARYGGWLTEPYPGTEGWTLPTPFEFLQRIWWQFTSTERGQLWFNSVGIVVLALGCRRWWQRSRDTLLLVLACIAGTLAFFGLMPFWRGGVCFGPRLQFLIAPLCALGWSHIPEMLEKRHRRLLGIGVAVSLVVNIPGLFVDPLCIDKHHEWLWKGRGPVFLAGWAEMRAAFGLGRPRLPEGLPASAYTLEKHPPFQRPDFWWVHAAAVSRERRDAPESKSQSR